jgi:ATP-binding cassette, subfamily B, bacterial
MTRPCLTEITWPCARLGEAIDALGRAAGLEPQGRTLEMRGRSHGACEPRYVSRWIEDAASWLSLQAEPVHTTHAEISELLERGAPALIEVREGDERRYVAILEGGKSRTTIIDPAGRRRRVAVRTLERALVRPLEERVAHEIDELLEHTVSARRRARARHALLRERLGASLVSGMWLLRGASGARLMPVARRATFPHLLMAMLAAHACEYTLVLLSWWAVAQGALQGRFDSGWLAAWMVMLLSILPLRVLGSWLASELSIRAGTLMKTLLLAGALRVDPDDIRHQGAGQLLGRVVESSAIETLGLTGGLSALTALVEIAISAFMLAHGAGGRVHVATLLCIVAFVIAVSIRYFFRRRRWTRIRLTMTHDLVERMVGHRTRIAQESPPRWHDGEDESLAGYLDASTALDRASILLSAVPQGWLLCGVVSLLPALLDAAPATASLAIALGGVLLGHGALQSLTSGVSQLAGAATGWDEARPLIAAARRADAAPAPAFAAAAHDEPGSDEVLLRAQDLCFHYGERGAPVLRGCSLSIRAGDRLLLHGASGGGKSTLGSLLTGLLQPQSGLLLLRGIDRHSLGEEGWRRRVVAAPQFHQNHIFSGTLAFNLLMGREWPPEPRDLAEAEAVCRALDLGPLLARMPSGLHQMVGETGWQLSHGEKSRVFIARALLQNADLVVLDESFAALDPLTLERTLACVLERARTLMVIAHP